ELEQHRIVDQLDVDTAFLDWLNPGGDLDELAGGGFGVGVRAVGGILHSPPDTLSRDQYTRCSESRFCKPVAHRASTFPPRSHAAYFRAVQSRSSRQASKSALVRLDKNTIHAAKNAARALSNVAAVPDVHSPGRDPG